MGGEKLKSSLPFGGVFFAILFVFVSLFCFTFSLSAQSQDLEPVSGESTPLPEARNLPDESSFVIGEPAEVPAPVAGSSVFVALRMVLVLALAALAIYGVVFFIKRLAKPREALDPHLKVLAKVSLGSDSYAAVVSVGAKAWLVGGGSGGLNLISEIDDPESLETMLIEDAQKTAEAGTRRFFDFRALFSKMGLSSRGEKNAPPGQGVDSGSHAERLRKQRDRLKGL